MSTGGQIPREDKGGFKQTTPEKKEKGNSTGKKKSTGGKMPSENKGG